MKQKITSKYRLILASIVLAVMSGFILFSDSSEKAAAVDYNSQIQELQAQIEQNQAIANSLHDQANNLQNALNLITAEKNAIQSQIDLNTVQLNQLTLDIASNEEKLERQKRTISKTIAQIYVNSTTSPIEILASSKSVGEYVSQQEVRTSVRNQMKVAMDEVKRIRTELQNQKKEVEELIATQKSHREELAIKEAQQASLVEKTRGEEAAYQGLVSELQKQRQAAEAALARSLASGSYRVAPVGYIGFNEVVGGVGNSGLSSGPHLHLEVRQSGSRANPFGYIGGGWQAPGGITQGYGESPEFYGPSGHPGVDYGGGINTPIRAIAAGNMYRGCSDELLGTYNNAYGYVAIVEHTGGWISIYAHMNGGPSSCSYNTYW